MYVIHARPLVAAEVEIMPHLSGLSSRNCTSPPKHLVRFHFRRHTAAWRYLDFNSYSASNRCGNVEKRVERKARHPAAQKIVHAWLSYPTVGGSLRLCPFAFLYDGRDFAHEFGPGSQVGGLLGSVGNRVPDARICFGIAHFRFLSPERIILVWIYKGEPDVAAVAGAPSNSKKTSGAPPFTLFVKGGPLFSLVRTPPQHSN